ncbi:MAG: SPFH domain-containing protein, partial [Clostridia bacterium]|nr:SPFH domain-containing protein [Clostridia bacterium]
RLRGYGIYSFRVTNPKLFMKEMFGTNELYLADDVASQCRPMIVQAITDTIAESKMSILDLAANYKEFARRVIDGSEAEFDSYGLKLSNFVIENISLPDEVEKALDEKSKLSIMEDQIGTYTKYQAAQSIRDAAKNSGNGSNITGLGVGIGAAKVISDAFSEGMTTPTKTTASRQCIKCGAVIGARAKHCSECGASQVETKVCPNCGEEVSAKSKFCSHCGAKMEEKKVCPECGESLKPRAKFCANCGTKVQ